MAAKIILTPEQISDIRARVAGGESRFAVSLDYGVSNTFLGRYCRDLPKRTGGGTKFDPERLLALRAKGFHDSLIAEIVGCSALSIPTLIHRHRRRQALGLSEPRA